MRNNPVLVISNLSKANVENGFIADTGLKWVDLSYSEDPNNYQFSNSQISRKLETYFEGSNGVYWILIYLLVERLLLPTANPLHRTTLSSMHEMETILQTPGTVQTTAWNRLIPIRSMENQKAHML